jgi:hypothetical protein
MAPDEAWLIHGEPLLLGQKGDAMWTFKIKCSGIFVKKAEIPAVFSIVVDAAAKSGLA